MQELADIYAQCAAIGLHKAAVDEMEFWEVAAELGLAREEPDKGPFDPTAGRDLVRERVQAAMKGRPPPTVEPPTRPVAPSPHS